MQLFPKIPSGITNSVDPDQTAPEGAVWSGCTLFAYAILSDTLMYEILEHLPYSLLLWFCICDNVLLILDYNVSQYR